MWFSVEANVPFLDHRYAYKTLVLQNAQVIRRGMTKSILREFMKAILPENIINHKDKIDFEMPREKWFREPHFEQLVSEILNSERLVKGKLISTPKATRFYQTHLEDKTNISKEIWKWIHLEMWFRDFVDETAC